MLRAICWVFGLLFLSFSLPALSADYGQRADVTQFIDEISARHGLDKTWLTDNLAKAVYQPAVIKAILPGTKATRSWERYQGIMVSRSRIQSGLTFWKQNQAALSRAEKHFGVPASLIVSIIGIETIYGKHMGNFRLIDALTTLAFDYPRRAEFFKQELIQFFLLCKEQGWDPETIRGSYAGAIGLPQFMPSSYRQYAIDFDGDQKIHLFDSAADAIGSVANYLKEKGWQTHALITEPVTFKDALPETEAFQSPSVLPNLTAMDLAVFLPVWSKSEPKESFALILLETPDRPNEYWLGYQNFYVITRYNQSSFYAMSVFQLSKALEEGRSAIKP